MPSDQEPEASRMAKGEIRFRNAMFKPLNIGIFIKM